jgi:uncharacterized protein
LYILITYLISWTGVYYFSSQYDDLTMFVPGLVALGFCYYRNKKPLFLFNKSTLRTIGIAFFIPLAVSLIVIILATCFSLAKFGLPNAAIDFNNGSHFRAWRQFIFSGFPWLLATGIFFTLGEEIGWRGYLLPLLRFRIENFYYRAIFLGIIWGLWHVPLYLNVGMPPLNIGIFLFNVCLISIIFTWLFEKEKSIWPTLIVHAMHNILLNSILPMLMHIRPDLNERILFGEEGLLVSIAYLLVVLYLAGRGYFIVARYPSGQRAVDEGSQ